MLGQRFWSKVDKTGPVPAHAPALGPCWVWTAAVTAGGYAMVYAGEGLRVYGHRAAYEELVGPIPDGLTIDHLCRVRACVNPKHMEPVTTAENTRRGDGPAAVNSRKTECIRGHAFDEANTRINGNGSRACRACARERERVLRQLARLAR